MKKNKKDPSPINKPEKADLGLQTVASDKKEPGKEKRLDPTRYGDWEKGGRCIDF